MELEITIKVPLPAAGVSAQQSPVDGDASRDEVVHEPPSPAEFGLVTNVPRADVAPPSIEMIEQIAARSAMTNSPPGLEDVPFEHAPAGRVDAGAGPPDLPDLPDPSEVPSVSEEFAPPPVDDVEPAE